LTVIQRYIESLGPARVRELVSLIFVYSEIDHHGFHHLISVLFNEPFEFFQGVRPIFHCLLYRRSSMIVSDTTVDLG